MLKLLCRNLLWGEPHGFKLLGLFVATMSRALLSSSKRIERRVSDAIDVLCAAKNSAEVGRRECARASGRISSFFRYFATRCLNNIFSFFNAARNEGCPGLLLPFQAEVVTRFQSRTMPMMMVRSVFSFPSCGGLVASRKRPITTWVIGSAFFVRIHSHARRGPGRPSRRPCRRKRERSRR